MRNDLAISANMQFLRWLAQWIKHLLCKLADQNSDLQNPCKYQMGMMSQKGEIGVPSVRLTVWVNSGQVRDSASVNKVESGGEASQCQSQASTHMHTNTCTYTHTYAFIRVNMHIHTHIDTCKILLPLGFFMSSALFPLVLLQPRRPLSWWGGEGGVEADSLSQL